MNITRGFFIILAPTKTTSIHTIIQHHTGVDVFTYSVAVCNNVSEVGVWHCTYFLIEWYVEQAYSAGKATALCQSGSSPSLSLNAHEYLPVLEQNSRTPQYKSRTLCCSLHALSITNSQCSTNKVHKVLPEIVILHDNSEYCYMFQPTRDHHQATSIK